MADISPNTSWTSTSVSPSGSWSSAQAGPSNIYSTHEIFIWGSGNRGFMEMFWEAIPSNWEG